VWVGWKADGEKAPWSEGAAFYIYFGTLFALPARNGNALIMASHETAIPCCVDVPSHCVATRSSRFAINVTGLSFFTYYLMAPRQAEWTSERLMASIKAAKLVSKRRAQTRGEVATWEEEVNILESDPNEEVGLLGTLQVFFFGTPAARQDGVEDTSIV